MGTFIVSSVLIFIVVMIIRSIIRKRKNSGGCGCGCSGCSCAEICRSKK